MRAIPLTLLFSVILLSGCVTGGGTAGSTGAERNRISLEEIQSQPHMSAFELVNRLRPAWLRGHSGSFRSETGRNTPEVFVDGRPYGSMESLNQFFSETLQEIRFISAPDATTRFGTGYPAGIIEIITRR